jgi:AraC family transcriptional regulator
MDENRGERYRRQEYIARINRVLDYVESHIDEPLTLHRLSDVAHFSPYHFHRIFHAMVGEPLYGFIQRIRLERAATKLIDQPKLSITEIALECGFSGSSTFARAFRERFGMSATQWRCNRKMPMSNIRQRNGRNGNAYSNMGQDRVSSSNYTVGAAAHHRRRNDMIDENNLKVDVSAMPEMNVAYVRHIGPYKGDTELFGRLFNTLFKWAGARDLLRFPETRVLAVYHDNPDVTDESRLRTSVCITVPEDTQVEGEVGMMKIPGGKYAVGHFEIDETEFEAAWNALYGGWLPDSGYQPDDRPSFEMCLNDPKEHPQHKHIVDICVPVKPL